MKEKDGFIDFPDQQVILYVEKEDGQYGPMQTGSGISMNYLDDYKLKREHLDETLRTKVVQGEMSPIQYFMVLEDLTISELAARTGLKKRIVKKHLDPLSFGKVTVETLKKYADVFNIPIANLLQVIMIKKDSGLKSYTFLEEENQVDEIEMTKTRNPFVVLTKIGNI